MRAWICTVLVAAVVAFAPPYGWAQSTGGGDSMFDASSESGMQKMQAANEAAMRTLDSVRTATLAHPTGHADSAWVFESGILFALLRLHDTTATEGGSDTVRDLNLLGAELAMDKHPVTLYQTWTDYTTQTLNTVQTQQMLVVMNGVPSNIDAVKRLAPTEITTVTLSHDTELLKRYGASAKNGVLVVTTHP